MQVSSSPLTYVLRTTSPSNAVELRPTLAAHGAACMSVEWSLSSLIVVVFRAQVFGWLGIQEKCSTTP